MPDPLDNAAVLLPAGERPNIFAVPARAQESDQDEAGHGESEVLGQSEVEFVPTAGFAGSERSARGRLVWQGRRFVRWVGGPGLVAVAILLCAPLLVGSGGRPAVDRGVTPPKITPEVTVESHVAPRPVRSPKKAGRRNQKRMIPRRSSKRAAPRRVRRPQPVRAVRPATRHRHTAPAPTTAPSIPAPALPIPRPPTGPVPVPVGGPPEFM